MSLYKYNPENSNTLDALRKSQLYFSDPSNFNDPFDAKPELIEVDFQSDDDVRSIIQRLQDKFDDNLKRDVQNMDISNLKTLLKQKYDSLLKSQFNDIGVCCFSKTLTNNVMWYYYAQEHQGFALEFDPVITEGKDINISYTTDFPKVNALEIGLRKEPVMLNAIFRNKSPEWAHEQEVRLLTEGKSIRRTFKPEYLLNIYLGRNSSEELKTKIQTIQKSKYPHAIIYKMKLVQNTFALKPTPI